MPDTPPPSPAGRRLATPGWLDLRLVLGVALVLASVLLGATLVSRADRTTATVATTRDLAAGTVLHAGDLVIRRVQLPGDGRGVYLQDTGAAVGKQLVRPVSRGELLPRAAVSAVAARTTVTVPLAAGAAPDLRSGQRIELWLSTASCASVVLLPDVTVQGVRSDGGGSFGSSSGGQDVVISVEPALAERVIAALAVDQAKIRAGVLVGGAAPAGAPASSSLPDLAPCASASPGR